MSGVQVRNRARGFGGLVTAVLIMVAGCLVVLAGPTPAHACDCPPLTRDEAIDRAEVILFGTVRSVRPTGDPAGHELTIDVRSVFKGTAYAEQVVRTPAAEACGVVAEPGATMVIFAAEQLDPATDYAYELISTQCDGNLVTGTAPAELGRAQEPLPGSSTDVGSADRTNDLIGRIVATIGLGALGIAIIVAAGLFWLWRPGRPTT